MREWVDVRWERLDERFESIGGDRRLERIFAGGRWLEGPAYSPAWRCLLFSDIPNDRTLRWDETTGVVGTFAQPAGHANGRTIDRQGRVVTCEHGGRRVTRTEYDGTTTVLADSWQGKRFNSPNDVVERADGTVWFTDPSYGIETDYEGDRAESEIGGCYVFRIDPDGAVEVVADDFVRPNGLAFSADESQLYIVDTRARHIRRFGVSGEGGLDRRGGVRGCRRIDVRRRSSRRGGSSVGRGRGRHPLLRPGRDPARKAPAPGDRIQPHLRRRRSAISCSSPRPGLLYVLRLNVCGARYPT